MQALELRMPRPRTTVAGDRYSIYSNHGLGEVDCDGAPLAGDIPFWPGTRPHAGHLNEAHLCWGHQDHAVPDGHLVGAHLTHGHLQPEAILRFITPLYYLGHYVLAMCIDDAGGNRAAASPTTVAYTINSSPRAGSDFAKSGYDAEADRITFALTPSRDFVS